ncbi:hypothetical protein Q7C_1678 [Methylophaga frappieri]|uniref:Uncharacterized protein n=1 Tax=Methylophaga frappieri (strain ATCC BAA-2434 / DSM 25690 / JAM7) TaxID=754477 RepID=I1YIT2_METFJ|nr:hypothetical protein Q7C_1678 [Methylophaga frappieri]
MLLKFDLIYGFTLNLRHKTIKQLLKRCQFLAIKRLGELVDWAGQGHSKVRRLNDFLSQTKRNSHADEN